MDSSKFNELVQEIHEHRVGLCGSKSKDYANVDALANFKRMSNLCALLHIDPARSPVDAAHFLMMLKVDRWRNLLRNGGQPQNESIRDTVEDLHNYIDLAYACQVEEG